MIWTMELTLFEVQDIFVMVANSLNVLLQKHPSFNIRLKVSHGTSELSNQLWLPPEAQHDLQDSSANVVIHFHLSSLLWFSYSSWISIPSGDIQADVFQFYVCGCPCSCPLGHVQLHCWKVKCIWVIYAPHRQLSVISKITLKITWNGRTHSYPKKASNKAIIIYLNMEYGNIHTFPFKTAFIVIQHWLPTCVWNTGGVELWTSISGEV